MILAITGTPGTGKSSVCEALAHKMNVKCYHLNHVVIHGFSLGYDKEKDSIIADLEALKKKFQKIDDGIIEGHYSHKLGVAEVIIVLRTRPNVLSKRLKEKGFSQEKIRENLECEALDLCLIESLETCERVYEIDTSSLEAKETAEIILKILREGGKNYLPGKIDWSEEYFYSVSHRNS